MRGKSSRYRRGEIAKGILENDFWCVTLISFNHIFYYSTLRLHLYPRLHPHPHPYPHPHPQGFAVAFRSGALTHQDLLYAIGIHPTIAEEFTTMTIAKSSGESIDKKGC